MCHVESPYPYQQGSTGKWVHETLVRLIHDSGDACSHCLFLLSLNEFRNRASLVHRSIDMVSSRIDHLGGMYNSVWMTESLKVEVAFLELHQGDVKGGCW